jgi:large subunit ribosomal protein L25
MAEIRISAEPRDDFGKGAARKLRRTGKVPAVLYGHKQDNVHLALPGHELFLALKMPNVLLNLDIAGKSQLALPKAVQRHPVKRDIEHIDLLLVRRGEKVTVEVPIVALGDIAAGGLLEHTLNTVPIEAEATHIPASIEVSVAGLEIGGRILARDLALPRGAALALDPEHTVLHVLAAPTAAQLAGETAETEGAVAVAVAVADVETPAEA